MSISFLLWLNLYIKYGSVCYMIMKNDFHTLFILHDLIPNPLTGNSIMAFPLAVTAFFSFLEYISLGFLKNVLLVFKWSYVHVELQVSHLRFPQHVFISFLLFLIDAVPSCMEFLELSCDRWFYFHFPNRWISNLVFQRSPKSLKVNFSIFLAIIVLLIFFYWEWEPYALIFLL